MQIPQEIQLPLYEPIYASNGQLTPVWAMFFEHIVQLLNSEKLADLIVLMQLASQLQDQSQVSQMSVDLEQMRNTANLAISTYAEVDQIQQLIQISTEPEKPLEAVFLMPQEVISP